MAHTTPTRYPAPAGPACHGRARRGRSPGARGPLAAGPVRNRRTAAQVAGPALPTWLLRPCAAFCSRLSRSGLLAPGSRLGGAGRRGRALPSACTGTLGGLLVSGGSGQAARAGTAFADPLAAEVVDTGGCPLSNVRRRVRGADERRRRHVPRVGDYRHRGQWH